MFEYYVFNYDHNKNKVVPFNIFNNWVLDDAVQKEVKKYIRSPKKYKYESFMSNEETKYGFEGLCREIDHLIKWQEWARYEYEMCVGAPFTTDCHDILKHFDEYETLSELREEIQNETKRKPPLEKIDCYMQCKDNIPMITRECIYQYRNKIKEQK